MRPYRVALGIVTAGLLTFGIVFTLLQVTRSDAAPGQVAVAPTATPPAELSIATSADSLAPLVAPGHSAVGVPIAGSEPLLRDVQRGDRIDVLASLPAPEDGRPVTAVVVRGATVLRPATSNDPLLLDVSDADTIVLAHLVLGGTKLGYAVWPANGSGPPEPQALDERTARALLGLSVPATPTPVPAPSQPPAVVAPAATAEPRPSPAAGPAQAQQPVGGFIYQVQPGDTWNSIAATFGLSPDELRQWNDAAPEAPLDPGTLLVIPRRAGQG
jgi:LysM repeat protein